MKSLQKKYNLNVWNNGVNIQIPDDLFIIKISTIHYLNIKINNQYPEVPNNKHGIIFAGTYVICMKKFVRMVRNLDLGIFLYDENYFIKQNIKKATWFKGAGVYRTINKQIIYTIGATSFKYYDLTYEIIAAVDEYRTVNENHGKAAALRFTGILSRFNKHVVFAPENKDDN